MFFQFEEMEKQNKNPRNSVVVDSIAEKDFITFPLNFPSSASSELSLSFRYSYCRNYQHNSK